MNEFIITMLVRENEELLKTFPRLNTEGDFSPEGTKFFDNTIKIEKVKGVFKHMRVGPCECGDKQIKREGEVDYCAWCHREVIDLTAEYLGKPCTVCEIEITSINDNQDGLCVLCGIEAVQSHCP